MQLPFSDCRRVWCVYLHLITPCFWKVCVGVKIHPAHTVAVNGWEELWLNLELQLWVRIKTFACYFIVYIFMCRVGMWSNNGKCNRCNFGSKDCCLTQGSAWTFVYHSVHGPQPELCGFFRKWNTLQRRLVCAERTRKIYLIKSIRTHFLSSSLLYSAEWCRVPTALNNVHFDLLLNSINKCEHRIHILAISQSWTYYQINGVF